MPNEGSKAIAFWPLKASPANDAGTRTDPPKRPTMRAAARPTARVEAAEAAAAALPSTAGAPPPTAGSSDATTGSSDATTDSCSRTAAESTADVRARASHSLPSASPMGTLLTMPSTPMRSSPTATSESATDCTGAQMGSGPSVPHKKETTMAVPPQTPWPVLRPILLAAMKLNELAITKIAPARKPNHVNASEVPASWKKGTTSHDERKTPRLTYPLKSTGCSLVAATDGIFINATKMPLKNAEPKAKK